MSFPDKFAMKKKVGKKKNKVTVRSEEEAAMDPADPTNPQDAEISMMSASDGQTPTISVPQRTKSGKAGKSKKKGKKGKKTKLTKEEKQNAKMDKLVKKYIAEQKRYESFVNRLDRWLKEKAAYIISIFSQIDKNGDGHLSYAEFKSAMIDMEVPCSFIELHLLCTTLDTDRCGHIQYKELEQGLWHFKQVENVIDEEAEEELENRICLTGTRPVEWVQVMFRFVTFENELRHPGHFEKVLTISTYVKASLMSLSKKHKHLLSILFSSLTILDPSKPCWRRI